MEVDQLKATRKALMVQELIDQAGSFFEMLKLQEGQGLASAQDRTF